MALAADRNTPEKALIPNVAALEYPCAAATTFYAGGLGCLNAAGYATKGAVATTLIAVGRIELPVDNSAGAAGDKNVKMKPGIFRFSNSAAADAIARAEIGDDCYIVDDATVAKTDGTGTRSKAGRIVDVDADGVWVAVGLKFLVGT